MSETHTTHTTHRDAPKIDVGPDLAQWQSLRLVTSWQVLPGFKSRSGTRFYNTTRSIPHPHPHPHTNPNPNSNPDPPNPKTDVCIKNNYLTLTLTLALVRVRVRVRVKVWSFP